MDAGTQEVAGRCGAGIQYDADAGQNLREVRTEVARDPNRVQVCRGPDDGARNHDGRGRVWGDWVFAVPAGARWSAELSLARERHGGRGQDARPTGGGSSE